MAFQFVRGNSALRCALIAAGVYVSITALNAHAATLLDFPSPSYLANGRVYAWRSGSSFIMEDPTEAPFRFTYAIGSNFLANESDLTRDQAESIVHHALHAWTIASRERLFFEPAPWPAVMNIGPTPPDQWEGPSVLSWLTGDYPGTYPGWGANFEFFSVPTGFQITSQGVHYKMKATSLAFTVVNRIGSTHIVSVDIYFNSDFDWFDATTEGGIEAGAYDLATVLLHELGHALGLDHPNQASGNGSWNFNPYTFAPGDPWSPDDLMYAYYQGARDHPTIDEVGGMAFLYGLSSPLDLMPDGVVSGDDLAALLTNWGANGLGALGDLDYNGVVNSIDLGLILTNFGPLPEPLQAPESGQPDNSAPIMQPIIRDCYHIPLNEAELPK